MTTERKDIYDVNKYTEDEILEILDLNNPTDRELEGKLHVLINKYEIMQTKEAKKLLKFFCDIYERLFETEEDDVVEGFGNNSSSSSSSSSSNLNPLTEISETSQNFISNGQVIKSLSSLQQSPNLYDLQQNKNSRPINYTKSLDYTKGKINPILKETITRIINIDSKYRDRTHMTASNFTFNLNEILKDVVSLKLYSITIPCTWNTVPNDFGVNFFYLKGNAVGITDGNSDYKISVSYGNYTNNTLVDSVNAGIQKLKLESPDVSFGNTSIRLNPYTLKTEMVINIKKIYNDMYYNIYFPSWTDPNLDINGITSIPALLGFNNKTYGSYNLYSIPTTTQPQMDATTILTSNTNNFIVALYYPRETYTNNNFTGMSGYDPTSKDNNLISISIGNTGVSSTLKQIISYINDAFANNPILKNSSFSSDIIYINKVKNYRYKMSIIIDRTKLTSFNQNLKAAIIFPSTVWTALFNFNNLVNELNNIYSETEIVSSYYPINNGPYMYLKCIKPYYGNNGVEQHPDGFNSDNSVSYTYNVTSNADRFEIGVGNYIIYGKDYNLINKNISMNYGTIDISGTKYDISGSNYNITPYDDTVVNLSGTFNVSGSTKLGGSMFQINSSNSYTYNKVDSPIRINGIINVTSGQTFNYDLSNYNTSGIDISGNNYRLTNATMTGDTTISGSTSVYSNDGSLYTVSGEDYSIKGKSTIFNSITMFSGNMDIFSRNLYQVTINNETYGPFSNVNTNILIDKFKITLNNDLNQITKITSNPEILVLSESSFEITCTDCSFTSTTQIYGDVSTNLTSNNSYTLSGSNYKLTSTTNVYGKSFINSGNGSITTTQPIRISGTHYDICSNNIECTGLSHINYGNIKITSTYPYNVITNGSAYLYDKLSTTNIKGPIHIQSGNLEIKSDISYNISGNSYLTNDVSGQSLYGNTYIISGRCKIRGYGFTVRGNVEVYSNITNNDFIIPVLKSGLSTQTNVISDYFDNLNTSCNQAISINPNLSGSSILFYIDSLSHHGAADFIINKKVTGENFRIDLSGSFFQTVLLVSSRYFDGSSNTITYDGSFNPSASGVNIADDQNVIKITGAQSSCVSTMFVSKVIIPTNLYTTIDELQTAINLAFNSNYPNINNELNSDGIHITNCSIAFNTIPGNNTNKFTWKFTMNIYAEMTTTDYSVYFYDNNLIANQIPDTSNNYYDNVIWTNTTNTWYKYLYIPNQNYRFNTNNDNLARVLCNQTLSNHTVTLDNSSNYFIVEPRANILYGIPFTENYSVTIIDFNNQPLIGIYPLEVFMNYFNYTMSTIPDLSGTFLSAFATNGTDQKIKIQLRLNINRTYYTSDFNLVFFDPDSFSFCNTGFSGTKSIKAVEWDITLGWLLGYTNLPIYNLIPQNLMTNPIDNTTYYNGYTDNYYIYNTTENSATLFANAILNTNIYSNFMIILEDYAQNHLNDGLVTLSYTDNNIPTPSYANTTITACNQTDNRAIITNKNDQYNSLTTNQAYAANQIYASNQALTNTGLPKNVYSSRGYLEDIFAVIPMNTVPNGGMYVAWGSTLMVQERSYFGPINISRMSVKLVSDKGNMVDLNGSDWSFSLTCQKLYTPST